MDKLVLVRSQPSEHRLRKPSGVVAFAAEPEYACLSRPFHHSPHPPTLMDDPLFDDPASGMQSAGKVAAALKQAVPLLTLTLHDQWHTEQGTQVRQVLWSLYTSSHLVNLGKACTGLDRPLAEALMAAIDAHLILGPEAEPVFDSILRDSGEIARFEEVERATPEHLPVIYPNFPIGLPALCQIAAAMDHLEDLGNDPPR